MFTPGAHVRVVESSVGQGTGPRCGSLGYFVSMNHRMPLYHSGFNCAGFASTVVFHKYGQEERDRKEVKTVIALFPVERITVEAIAPFLKLKQRISNAKYKDWRTFVRNNYNSSKKTPLVVITPVGATTSLDTCNTLEFGAWVESVLRGTTFGYINNMLITPHFKTNKYLAKNRRVLMMMRDMSVNKDYRKSVLTCLAENTFDIGREEFIRLLQTVLAMSASSCSKEEFRLRNDIIGGGEYHTAATEDTCIATVLCEGLFNPQLFDHTVKACNHHLPSDKFMPILRNVNALKETALGLS